MIFMSQCNLKFSPSRLRINMFRKLPLRLVLIVPFVLQIAAVVGLTGWLSLRNGQKAVNDVMLQLSSGIAARIDQHAKEYLSTPHLFHQINLAAIRNGDLDVNNFDALQRHFWSQIQINDAVDYIYFGNENGDFLGVQKLPDERTVLKLRDASTAPKRFIYDLNEQGKRTELTKMKDYDPRQRPWYQVAELIGQPTWSPIYHSAHLGVLQITPVVPIYDKEGQFLGALATNLLLSQISDFLDELSISPAGHAFIIERSGAMVASSTKETFQETTSEKQERLQAMNSKEPAIQFAMQHLFDQVSKLHQIEAEQTFSYEMNGTRQLVQVKPLQDGRGLNWLIVVVIPETDFMEQIRINTYTTIGLCLVALVLAAGVGIYTSRWISGPIFRLSEASSAIAKGALDQTVHVGRIKELGILAQSFNRMAKQLRESFTALENTNEALEQRVEERTASLRIEQEKSEQLLLNILPEPIANQLKQGQSAIAEHFDEVTILFADIVNFTPISTSLEAIELVNLLNQVFSTFDELAEELGLEKIKTIGDAYMVAAGLPVPRSDHAEAAAEMALAMQDRIKDISVTLKHQFQSDQTVPLSLRIGINTGIVVAGVIGTKKFIYDLWGDAVNIASRMESQGEPGNIQVTESTYIRLQEQYRFEKRGEISVKGKGKMMTYWLKEKRHTEVIAEAVPTK